MKKLLTIVVPAFNSEDYLERCVNSLLIEKARLQIILVDDGSKDQTPEIMDQYARQFPSHVQTIHQKNKGHGGVINAALKYVNCKYLKIVDSDDWLDFVALKKLLDLLERFDKENETVDMLICNYMYDKVNAVHKKIIRFTTLPQNCFFGWDQVKLPIDQYLMIHAIIYRTEVLIKANLQLPEHIFYEDNLYVFEPLIYVNKIYYFDINLYHYYIGRSDQSVNENVMLKRIDQQLTINKMMIIFYKNNINENTDLGRYMRDYLKIITTISSIILIRGNSNYYLNLKDELWQYLKVNDPLLYKNFKNTLLGKGVNLPGKLGREIASWVYSLLHKLYGFN